MIPTKLTPSHQTLDCFLKLPATPLIPLNKQSQVTTRVNQFASLESNLSIPRIIEKYSLSNSSAITLLSIACTPYLKTTLRHINSPSNHKITSRSSYRIRCKTSVKTLNTLSSILPKSVNNKTATHGAFSDSKINAVSHFHIKNRAIFSSFENAQKRKCAKLNHIIYLTKNKNSIIEQY